MSISLPSSKSPLCTSRLRCSFRSYPYFVTAVSARMPANSSALPSATASPTATVTLPIWLNIPASLLSVTTAQLPLSFASFAMASGVTSLNVSFFSSFADVGLMSPRYFLSEPNSYFSKRSATSGEYAPVTSASQHFASRGTSVLMVTRSWLISM